MTIKSTPEQIQRACDMLHGEYEASSYGEPNYYELTALADTIAQLDAMQAERDKARADLGEIDRIAQDAGWGDSSLSAGADISRIAAPYKVETDPLADIFGALGWGRNSKDGDRIELLRAELAKRGLEIGRSA